jgi:G3E family GTPase
MTRLILLSGFLGAGKTTLLQRMLDTMKTQGSRVAVISNDFGPVNVDGQLLAAEGPVIEITDGSMFCSCREQDFVEGVRKLSAYPLDFVLVEASGLSDPANLGDLLSEAGKDWPELSYAGTICVVDSEDVLDLADLMVVVPRQVAYADLIIANKADLVTTEELVAVVDWLETQNPGAELIRAVRCEIPLTWALGQLLHTKEASRTQTSNSCESRLTCIWLTCAADIPTNHLRAFLTDIAPLTHRIKGIVHSGGSAVEVSCVHRHVGIQTASHTSQNLGLVLIAAQPNAFYSRLVDSWEKYIHQPIHLA